MCSLDCELISDVELLLGIFSMINLYRTRKQYLLYVSSLSTWYITRILNIFTLLVPTNNKCWSKEKFMVCIDEIHNYIHFSTFITLVA